MAQNAVEKGAMLWLVKTSEVGNRSNNIVNLIWVIGQTVNLPLRRVGEYHILLRSKYL